uniref:Uncharacterized protein n=1 Tax=Arundo donax TaxID=35708 RepID=A0A0A8ZI88_ARUDO
MCFPVSLVTSSLSRIQERKKKLHSRGSLLYLCN